MANTGTKFYSWLRAQTGEEFTLRSDMNFTQLFTRGTGFFTTKELTIEATKIGSNVGSIIVTFKNNSRNVTMYNEKPEEISTTIRRQNGKFEINTKRLITTVFDNRDSNQEVKFTLVHNNLNQSKMYCPINKTITFRTNFYRAFLMQQLRPVEFDEKGKLKDIKKGSHVKVRRTATRWIDSARTVIPSFVFDDTWIVWKIGGERVVLGQNVSGTNNVNSPINIMDLIVVK